jgi:probable HAF family extracellular repeat protein
MERQMAVKRFRLLLAGMCLLYARAISAQQYTVTDLGNLGGTTFIEASAINASGRVVGSSPTESGPWHPFLWTQGTIQDLGVLPGTVDCYATAINDHDEVVGYCDGAVGGGNQAFRWTADTGFIALGTNSLATGINNNGDIVGYWYPPDLTGGRAFVYRDGTFVDLGFGRATGIDDLGRIVGQSGNGRALLWDQDGRHELGSLAGPIGFSIARAVGPSGPVGASTTGGPLSFHAVLWGSSGISNLGTLGGGNASAQAISRDLIVGSSVTASQANHAFLYDLNGPGYPVDLNDLIPADSGWVLTSANGVNAAGQIVGYAGSFHQRAFLLTPVQPPTAPR